MKCFSFCTSANYNISEIQHFLKEKVGSYRFYRDLIYCQWAINGKEVDVFIFNYGCISIWGVHEKEAYEIIEHFCPFEVKPLKKPIRDDSTYTYGEETAINEEEDEIILEADDVLIKLSVSYALTQSVKLIAFEASVDRTIDRTRHIPGELAKNGKISLSRKKISQQIGELFAERNSINLHSDILDTPEFFWRRPKYEPYYLMASAYMDIATRVDILNKRLNVIHELYDILSNELKHQHSSRLELVIICLIMIEVMIGLHNWIGQWGWWN